MSVFVQILLLVVAFVVFVVLAMYLSGLGLQRVCFKIIAELEEARAFSEARAVALQDERKNFFRVGTKNLRPRALVVLISDGLVFKAPSGKYYLDKEKLAEVRSSLKT
jgi:sensor histidine kinase regulating citrate/malate metabolism